MREPEVRVERAEVLGPAAARAAVEQPPAVVLAARRVVVGPRARTRAAARCPPGAAAALPASGHSGLRSRCSSLRRAPAVGCGDIVTF